MTVHMPETEAETVAAGLASAARRHFGGPAAIEGLRRESGGASRQTWSFDAVVAGQRHELILRRDPPTVGGQGASASATSLDRATEFGVLRAAFKGGVRAPEVLFELAAQDGLGEAFVMRRIGGIAIARKLLRDPPYADARKKIARPARRDPGAHPRRRSGDPAAAAASRGGRPGRRACARRSTRWASRSRCSSWRSPGSTGAGPRRPSGRCWCMATTAPATISPTKAA